MAQYLKRASMALFILSMLLPVADIAEEGYRPGILLAIFGVSTFRYVFSNPFALLCWASNITYLIAFFRSKNHLFQGRAFAITTIIFATSIWLEGISSWVVVGGMAYQAWMGAFGLLVIALFVREKQPKPFSSVGS